MPLPGPGRRIGVGGRDEHVVDTGLLEQVDDILEVCVVPEQPRGHMRDHAVTPPREPSDEAEGRLQALDRRRRHRDDDIARYMGEDPPYPACFWASRWR